MDVHGQLRIGATVLQSACTSFWLHDASSDARVVPGDESCAWIQLYSAVNRRLTNWIGTRSHKMKVQLEQPRLPAINQTKAHDVAVGFPYLQKGYSNRWQLSQLLCQNTNSVDRQALRTNQQSMSCRMNDGIVHSPASDWICRIGDPGVNCRA